MANAWAEWLHVVLEVSEPHNGRGLCGVLRHLMQVDDRIRVLQVRPVDRRLMFQGFTIYGTEP